MRKYPEEEESIPVEEWDWYQAMKKNWQPGDTVKTYRENKGWTQAELGERLGGINRQAISQIERGKRAISKKMALKLSALFNRPLERFLKV